MSFSLKGDEKTFSLSQEEPRIIVNHRILAKVNGKFISAYDVMKKMDVLFYKHFPEYLSSTEIRYQYYQHNWKETLKELINKELILSAAKESKLEISGGEVRQEIEKMFGPNVIERLNQAGLTLEEALEMVKGDLLLQKLLGAHVHSKVFRRVTPARVRRAYNKFIQNPKNARLSQWTYQIISVKAKDAKKSEEVAKLAHQLLEKGIKREELVQAIKNGNEIGRKSQISVSSEIKSTEKEISSTYKEILASLQEGAYSTPFIYKGKEGTGVVYRILYLKEKIEGGMPSFKEMENQLKEELTSAVIEEETDAYLKKLQKHFRFKDEDLKRDWPASYQPFSLNR